MLRSEEARQEWTRDGAAFDAVYRENAPRLRAFLRQMVGLPQAAEDLTQEIFTEFWRSPGGFDPARGSLRAYLFGIGRHRAAEWWRRSRPESPMPEEPEDGCLRCDPESRSVMADALRRLPPEQRMLLWLREVEGQSYAELAAIFEVPLGTVRSRLFMARQALQHIWLGTAKGDTHEMR